MNGPVAKAGSTPLFSSIMGIKVPISEAVIITVISEMAMVIPNKKIQPQQEHAANHQYYRKNEPV